MNGLERFQAIVRFEEPDYVPIFGFSGAPGMSQGCMLKTHLRLVRTGMPPHVGGQWRLSRGRTNIESWFRYWGTTGPIRVDFSLARGRKGFRTVTRTDGDYEIIESESGALTRQIIDNDITYMMPEFIEYPVRDRESWAFYRERMTPTDRVPDDELDERVRRYEGHDRPLHLGVGGAYGFLRGLLGPERLSVTLYDDPELIHEIMAWRLERFRADFLPVIERLRPEIVQMGEDLCYNHGMLISPRQFDEFCGEYYRAVCDCARANGADLVAVDTDGNAMEFTGLAESYG
ncbi:MAG: hypothetical protein ACOC8E_04415, partial [Planctomycetota bacterium]